MQKPKKIAIVENQKHQREALQMMLEGPGMQVYTAAKVAEAYQLIEELGDDLDVLVLDMSLADPEARNVTGADIAIRAREQHPDWTPERLIITAYPTAVNYRLALSLGVAAFLSKGEAVDEDFVRYIRVLALRRALRADRLQVTQALTSMSASVKTLSAAVEKFCSEILAWELDACLAAPYLLLLTDEGGTRNVATNTDLATGHARLYDDLQDIAQGITFTRPYVTWEQDADASPPGATEAERRASERLAGTALLPLASVKDFRLSLALLAPRPGESVQAEDAGKLAAVLSEYVRPSIIEHFLSILIQLDAQKHVMLKSISYLCHHIGHEQQRIVEGGVALGHLKEESDTHRSLRLMADDLRQTGAVLSGVAEGQRGGAVTTLEMRSLVEQEFESLRELLGNNAATLELRAEGSCRVRAGEDLRLAVKRVLQWLALRQRETPRGVAAYVYVLCAEREDGSSVTFEDRSRRLPQELREHLFEPFSTSLALLSGAGRGGPGVYLPLYLSQVIVEEKYGGRLEDESDEMGGEVGHRLVMCFGPPSGKEAAGT